MYQRLIPSILIHEGRLVKGERYAGYKDAGSPATTARAHNHQGADELIVCDIDASKQGQEPDFETLHKVAQECFMPLTIFGGINSLERAAKAMEIGADKIGLTTGALDNPSIIGALAHRYGAQAVVLGLDVFKDEDGQYKLFDHRTNKIIKDSDPIAWAQECVDLGCGEIRIMQVDREGCLAGFDLTLYKILRETINVPLLVEGGGATLDDVQAAYTAGVDGVCLGAMLVFSDSNLVKIKQRMRSLNINLRP